MKRILPFALAVLALFTAVAIRARAAQDAQTGRDISGFWELNFDSRTVPRANLAPSATRAKLDARLKGDAYAIRWCNLLGVPFIMDSGRPLDIRQGATSIIIAPENSSAPRYLYLDRTAHISDDIFDPATNGDSIARWEGDTLVVDTTGFHGEHGITAIPGGGFRTEKSHLVERYRLLKDGAVLSVTFTWTDPTVFRTPHSYEFRYYRLPSTYEPRQWLACDPFDDERAKFLETAPKPVAPAARTQSPRAASARNVVLEGDWVRVDPDGVGSFDGLSGVVPAAPLLPGVSAAGGGRGDGRGRGVPQSTGPNPEGVPYIVVAQPCSGFGGGRGNGGILINPDSGGVHFVEQKNEVIFAGERGGVRHIYLDRRGHPDLSERTPTPAGHSIGRYEGNTLVVETTGFTAGAVPGGGVRSPETRLVERFELSPDGQRLTIVYTWEDPKIYQKPHVYRLYFERSPAVKSNGALVSYALEEWCDAGDPIEKQSIVPPKQTIKK